MLQSFKSDSNSSLTLAEATQYHLSLNLEWLSGCQFNCKGCHVNKSSHGPVMAEVQRLGMWLNSMQYAGNYLPTLVFLGPTDFLTADNTVKVLSNVDAWGILRKFKRLSLQSTFLNMDNVDKIVGILMKHYRHMELELNFIIEPEQIENEKYLETIKTNRDFLIQKLQWNKHIASFAILNVYDYDQVKKNDVKKILNDYQALHAKVKDVFDSTIDFNFSMMRNSWWSNEDVEDAVKRVSRIFDAGVDQEFNQTIRFSFGKLEDSAIEKHYNWHQGNLYISPMIYERIVSFNDRLRVPLIECTVSETEAFETQTLIDQYLHVDGKDCNGCRYQASCSERNILTFMDMHEITGCIIAQDALDAINQID